MPVIIDSSAEIDGVRFREAGGDPAAPAASHWLLYTKAGGLYIEDSSAVVVGPFGTGGGGTWGCATLLNDSGGTVNAGDTVYISDYGTASAFSTNSGVPAGADIMLGIVEDATILSGATGLVRFFGTAPVSNLDASAAQGDRIVQSANFKQATPHTIFDFSEGDFGIALDTGTTPPVFLFGLPVQRNERVLRTAQAVDLNSATPQTLYNSPAGRSCIVTKIVVRNASTNLTTNEFSVGWNGASYNDVLANAAHVELTGSTLYTVLSPKIGAAIGAASTSLKIKSNVLQGGAATVDIDVVGYLF